MRARLCEVRGEVTVSLHRDEGVWSAATRRRFGKRAAAAADVRKSQRVNRSVRSEIFIVVIRKTELSSFRSEI